MMKKYSVLILIPLKPEMNAVLKAKALELSSKIPLANPAIDITIIYDYRGEESLPTDERPWSKVARVRNKLINSVNLESYTHVMWIDADIVDYPADIVTRLIEVNPNGISAPMVLVEDTDLFYDWAAFIEKDKSHIEPINRWNIPGRNFQQPVPYFSGYKENEVVEVDSVGAMYVTPAYVYNYTNHEDHAAFTDHFPLMNHMKNMKYRITVHCEIKVYHANLPKYGEEWH